MPIVCTRCGNVLSRDDSRFCNNCGASILAAPPSSAGSVPPDQTSIISQGEKLPIPQRPKLREQIAQQPGTPAQGGPPSWMSMLDKPDYGSRRRTVPRPVEMQPSPNVPPTPRPEVPPQPEVLPEQQGFHQFAPHADTHKPVRELRVKIWNEDTVQMVHASADVEEAPAPQEPELTIEQLPTSPLAPMPVEDEVKAPPWQEEAIEELPTGPLFVPSPSDMQMPPWRIATAQQVHGERVPPWHMVQDEHVRRQDEEPGPSPLPTALVSEPAPPVAVSPMPSPLPPPVAMPVTPRRRRRTPLVLLFALLLLVVLGVAGVWLWQTQPFSVPAVTQPYMTLSDKALGVMLRYPNDWDVQRKGGTSTVTLTDSTQTAQIVLKMANAGTGQINMQQQAASAGLTNLKPGAVAATVAFAGVTWQQMYGTMQQSGANYTGVLLATVYKQHVYTIVQLAPQGVYAQEEKVNFAPMRASLQFLN